MHDLTPYGTCPTCKRTMYCRITCCQEALLQPLLDELRRIRAQLGVELTGGAAPIDWRGEIARIDELIATYKRWPGGPKNG